jgi:hypothetical protein
MSKRINVNPNHYKVAGRERTDEIAKERIKIRKPKAKRTTGQG